jgi:hypothetical protein
VLRIRTDMVFFASLRLPTDIDHVYLPEGGMSNEQWLRCSNDHAFLCPRRLCRPYATLLHNFAREDCTPLPGFAAGGTGVLQGKVRPPPMRWVTPWYVLAAYNGSMGNRTRHVVKHMRNGTSGWTKNEISYFIQSCGRVRELGMLYALARGMDGGPSYLDCYHNLVTTWLGRHVRNRAGSAH